MAIKAHQGSEQHVVVGDLVAARLEPLAHLGEEGLLRLRVARQLDIRGLERVEREIDVEIALVVVTHGAQEEGDDELQKLKEFLNKKY